MGRRKYTYQEVYNMFLAEGYTLLSKEYINNKQQLNYICLPFLTKYNILYLLFNILFLLSFSYINISIKFKYKQRYNYHVHLFRIHAYVEASMLTNSH